MKWTLGVDDIVSLLDNPPVEGTCATTFSGFADLETASSQDITFSSGPKYRKQLEATQAGLVLVLESEEGGPCTGQIWVRVKDPSFAMGVLCDWVERQLRPRPSAGIHPTAIVAASAKIAPSAHVGPFCIIGPSVEIGEGVVLESHVRLQEGANVGAGSELMTGVVVGWGCQIGKRCRFQPGVVVGSDGFGYHSSAKGHQRLPQIGVVVIEDDVEIGANSTVDRARFAETRVGEGTKIDNLVQIGHNVIIGKHCILCAGTGIAGSTQLGNFVICAGQVGIAGHIKVGDGVTASGQAGITRDVPAGTVLTGTPARPRTEELRRLALLSKLPKLIKRVEELEKTYANR